MYSRKIYISNITCADVSSCLGTKTQPYDSFVKAIMAIHTVDLAQKYLEQKIQIYLLGSPHYILPSELPFPNMRFFRGMNATINIGPLFCEDDYAIGCVFGFRNEKVDFVFKTSNFLFEIWRNLSIYNLNIYANDIVLASNSLKTCYNSASICCNSSTFPMDFSIDECGLASRTIALNEKSKLNYFFSLFRLRVAYNDSSTVSLNLNQTPIPVLSITNVLFQNFYAIHGESSWLSLIMANTLGYFITIKNTYFQSNFLPYGYLITVSLEDDPYYNYLSAENAKNLYSKYPNSNQYNNSITIIGITIRDYNTFNFQIAAGSAGAFAPGLINLYDEQNSNAIYIFNSLNLQGFIFLNGFYFFSFLLPVKPIPTVIFNNTLMQNNQMLSLLNCENVNVTLAFGIFNNSIPGTNAILNVFTNGVLNIMNTIISNTMFSQTSNFISSTNFVVNIFDSYLSTLQECFAQASGGGFAISRSTIFLSLLVNSQFFLSFSDTNVKFDNFAILNTSAATINSYFFYFFSSSNINVTLINILMEYTLTYKVILYESSALLTNFILSNITFNKTEGLRNSKWGHHFFLDCSVGSFNDLTINGLVVRDAKNLELLLQMSYFNSMNFLNVDIVNIYGLQYYGFLLASAATSYKGISNYIRFENFSINGLEMNRSVDYAYLSFFGYLTFRNVSLKNLYFNETLAGSSSRVRIIIMDDIANLTVENCYFDYYKTSYYVGVFYIQLVDNITFTNNTFQGKYNNSDARVPAISAKTFINFTFVNNNVLNMSLMKTPMDIGDETGVVSILASGTYSSTGSLLTIVNVIGNYFFGNIGVKYGVLGIVGCTQTLLLNNTFEWGQSYYGGAIAIYLVSIVNIKNSVINNCQSIIGGGYYVYGTSGSFLADTLVMQNVSSANGAGLYFVSCVNFIIQNARFENLTVTQKGGVLYITTCSNVTLQNIHSKNSSAVTAGFIYIETSNVTLNQVECFLSHSSQIGGAMYLIGTSSFILIQKTLFQGCFSGADGAILSSLNIRNLTVVDTFFMSSYTQTSGNGVINLGGFYILKAGEIKNYGSFILRNISCLHNIAKLGGCVYFSSNNILILQDIIVSNVTGSLFNIESDGSVSLAFNNLIITQSNFYVYQGNSVGFDLSNPLLVFINLDINMTNLVFNNNTAESSLMKIISANATISNSNFCNFFNTFGKSSVSPRFFYISDSFISFDNIEFYYSNSSYDPCMFLEIRSSNVLFNECNMHDSQTLDLACISSVDSELNILKSNFINLGGTLGTVSCKSSNIWIEASLFKMNTNTLHSTSDDQASDLIFSDDSLKEQVVIIKSFFFHLDKNSLVIKNALKVTINETQFMAISNASFSRAVYLDQNSVVDLYSCIFEGFQAEIGGALSLYQLSSDQFLMYVNVFNCTFFNNTAFYGGSVYLRGSIYLRILSSIFNSNTAKITYNYTAKVIQDDTGKGGCIIADCEYYPKYVMEMNDTVFSNNLAEKYGPTMLSKSFTKNRPLFFDISLKNNSDNLNFTAGLSNSPVNVYLLSSNFTPDIFTNLNLTSNSLKIGFIRQNFEISWAQIASGQEFNFSMILTDSYDQLLIFESKVSADLTCLFYNTSGNISTYETVFVDKGTAQAINGIIAFTGTRIVMTPNNNITCTVSVSLSDSVFFKSTLEIGMNGTLDRTIKIPWNLYVRNCIKGELLMEDKTCFQCLTGTYLFDDPMVGSQTSKKCNNCPDNAYCKGGKYISPLAGFWRFTDQTALILECSTQEACLGIGESAQTLNDLTNMSEVELINGKCHPNYWGNLCSMCKKGYARLKTGQNCQECSSMVIIYVKMVLSFIFIVGYIAMQAKIFSNIDKNDPNLAILMKLLLNHFQTISMITLVDLGWTPDFNFYFNVLDYLSFLFQDFFVIDCLVVDINQDLLVQKIIFTILLPVILSLLMITIWMISFFVLLYRKSRHSEVDSKFFIFISEKMRITLLILVFILYPEILRKCFSLLNCLLIDDSDQYTVLTASPNVQCWNGDHTLWVLTVSMPGLIVWGLLTPLIIFLVLRKYKSKIQTFIFETHKNFTQKKSTMRKKEIIILKTIYLDIDFELRDKIFVEKTAFPVKNEIKYKKGMQIFSERVEVRIKERKEIIEEMRLPTKETSEELKQFSKILEVDMVNNDKLIKEPTILFEYLNFADCLKEKSISKEDLNEKLVRIREEFSTIEKNDENPDDALVKVRPKPVEGETTVAPKTYLVIKNLGFIYRGYRPEFYFWETVMFTRKFLLIFIGVFTEFFPKKTKPTMLIIILVGYIYLQIKFKPYQFAYLNKLEAYSLVVAFLTGNIGILLFSDFLQSLSVFFLFLIFGINILYFSVWIKCLIVYGNLKDKIEQLSKAWKYWRRRITKSLFG